MGILVMRAFALGFDGLGPGTRNPHEFPAHVCSLSGSAVQAFCVLCFRHVPAGDVSAEDYPRGRPPSPSVDSARSCMMRVLGRSLWHLQLSSSCLAPVNVWRNS